MSRPNILLVCADMIGARNFGCYGDRSGVTPHVDRLASGGTVFEQAYCACPPCIPARASMMTGQYAHTHGKTAHVQMPLCPEPPLLPAVLAQQGYSTGLVGKTHWWPPSHNLGCTQAHITIDDHLTTELGEQDAYMNFLRERGILDRAPATWQESRRLLDPDGLPEDCLKANWTGDTACALLEQYLAQDTPFFLFCSFVEPHGAGSVSCDHLEALGKRAWTPVIDAAPGPGNKPRMQQQAAALHSGNVTPADIQNYRRGVQASLSLVDRNVGKLMSALARSGRQQDTVLIFLSDHGDLMYDHGLVEKTFLYEAAVRVPLVLNGPHIPPGVRRRHLASHVDLMPTILELCAVEPEGLVLEGRSLVPVMRDPLAPWRETLFCEVDQTVHLRGLAPASSAKMLRHGPWKYIYTLTAGHGVAEELYNLETDPDELLNRAQHLDCLQLAARFRGEILRWLVATEPHRLHPAPENRYPVPQFGPEHY
jgi:arylsulfatase